MPDRQDLVVVYTRVGSEGEVDRHHQRWQGTKLVDWQRGHPSDVLPLDPLPLVNLFVLLAG